MQLVIDALGEIFGLDPTRGGLVGTLTNHVEARLAQLGIDERGFVQRLRTDHDEQQRLAHAITVRHSWFYRDPGQLEALAASLRARRDRGLSQPLDVWVAGCACGEEAWTIAMVAADLGVPIHMLATDLDGLSLREAEAGVYGSWSLRELPEHLRRFIEPTPDGRWRIGAHLRTTPIEFAIHNLCEPMSESFDVISCRNVLIYFEPKRAQRVADQLRQCLRPGGELILGAGDLLFRPDDSRQMLSRDRLERRLPPPPTRVAPRMGDDTPATAKPKSRESVRPPPPPPTPPASRLARNAAGSPAPSDLDFRFKPPKVVEPPAVVETPALVEPRAVVATDDERSLLAAQMVEAGDYQDALPHLTELVSADPLDPEAHLWAGIAHFGLGQDALAAEALRRARCLAPQLWPATLFAALTNERRGMWEPAARCWAELERSLASDDAPAIRGTAALLDALPRWRVEALSLARQRISKHPGGGPND